MPGQAPESITDLLFKWSGGDATALEQLMPLVYDELRRLAVRYLRRERDNHSLQPTALVNEPFSCPKSSDSINSAGTAAQLSVTKGPACRALFW